MSGPSRRLKQHCCCLVDASGRPSASALSSLSWRPLVEAPLETRSAVGHRQSWRAELSSCPNWPPLGHEARHRSAALFLYRSANAKAGLLVCRLCLLISSRYPSLSQLSGRPFHPKTRPHLPPGATCIQLAPKMGGLSLGHAHAAKLTQTGANPTEGLTFGLFVGLFEVRQAGHCELGSVSKSSVWAARIWGPTFWPGAGCQAGGWIRAEMGEMGR